MKLERWALITEIVSGVAVVASILLLVAGVRDNTNVNRALAYERILDSMNQIRLETMGNQAIFDASTSFGVPSGELTEDEVLRRRLFALSIFANYEKAFYAHQYGVLGDEEWDRFLTTACEWHARVGPDVWATMTGFTTQFLVFVEDNCA